MTRRPRTEQDAPKAILVKLNACESEVDAWRQTAYRIAPCCALVPLSEAESVMTISRCKRAFLNMTNTIDRSIRIFSSDFPLLKLEMQSPLVACER
jgi:hypothetical protein